MLLQQNIFYFSMQLIFNCCPTVIVYRFKYTIHINDFKENRFRVTYTTYCVYLTSYCT